MSSFTADQVKVIKEAQQEAEKLLKDNKAFEQKSKRSLKNLIKILIRILV